jgi:hypothetical protein
MQSTNIKFIYHVIEKKEFKFFTIYNVNNSVVYDFSDEDATPDLAKEAIENFLSMNNGVFKITLRKLATRGRGGTKAGSVMEYTINNMVDSSKPTSQPMGHSEPSLNPNDSHFYTMLRELQEDNKRLQNETLSATLNHMQESNRLNMELMQQKLISENSSKDDGMQQMAMQALAGIFGGGGVNALAGHTSGMNDKQATTEDMGDLNAIEIAVKGLMELDSDFEKNITKLHQLAKTNKPIYDMAIKQLNNF